MRLMKFLREYEKRYGTIDAKKMYKYITNRPYIIKDGIVMVYIDKGEYIENTLLLFDIKQVKNKMTAMRQFKQMIKEFKKPVHVKNVKKEFERLTKKINKKTYVWNV
jgi:hypothetical protein